MFPGRKQPCTQRLSPCVSPVHCAHLLVCQMQEAEEGQGDREVFGHHQRQPAQETGGGYHSPTDGACPHRPRRQRSALPQGPGFLYISLPTSKEFAKLNTSCSSPTQTQRAREEIYSFFPARLLQTQQRSAFAPQLS